MITDRDKMFAGYDAVPVDYVPTNLNKKPLDDNIPRPPLSEYDAAGNLIGYKWTYGDEIVLEFTAKGIVFDEYPSDSKLYYDDILAYLANKFYRLEIYNANYDLVYDFNTDKLTEAKPTVSFLIDNKLSKKIFTRGIYRARLTLIDTKHETENVVFDMNDATLFVQ